MARPTSFRIMVTLTSTFLAVFAASNVWGDEDPIKTRIERSQQSYQKEMDEHSTSVIKIIEGKIEVARKSGNRAQIDSLNADLESFKNDEILPMFVSMAVRRKQAVMRAKLEKAYESAIKEYSKASQDAQAKEIGQQLKDFRNEPARRLAKKSLLGTWQVTSGNYTTAFTFDADGTVKYDTEKVTLPWKIDVENGYVLTGDPDAPTDKIKLPLDEKGTSGLSANGNTIVLKKGK